MADEQLKQRIARLLRGAFNDNSTVDVTDGYQDNIHVVVVSKVFDGKTEKEKQEILWHVIDSGDLSDPEKLKISMALPYSPADLK